MKNNLRTKNSFNTTEAERLKKAVTAKVEKLANAKMKKAG